MKKPKMIDYIEWSKQYHNDAKKILEVIERKKELLKGATKDERKTINEQIITYRCIYYDLLRAGDLLAQRAKSEMTDGAA